jgi:hypothetical protein
MGKFTILKTYELQSTDLVTSGVVALSQSEEYPQLLVEFIYPTPAQSVPELQQLLQPGLEVHLEKTLDLSAILHVGHALDGRLQVTTMPLLYGNYALKNGVGTFSLEPPKFLNVAAGFPLVRGEEVRSVMREQLDLKRQRMVSKSPQPPDPAMSPQLVRLDLEMPASSVPLVGPLPMAPPPPKAETTIASEAPGPIPEVPAKAAPKLADAAPKLADAMPKAADATAGKPSTAKLPGTDPLPAAIQPVVTTLPKGAKNAPAPQVVAAVPVAAKVQPKAEVILAKVDPAIPKAEAVNPSANTQRGVPVTPPPKTTAKAPPVPTLTQATASAVSVAVPVRPAAVAGPQGEAKPFVAAAPSAVPTGPTGSWKTYNSGQQPGGRVVSTEQATALAGRNDSGRLYLRGQFVVTATGNNRAVLRQARGDDRTPPARVIVEYPAGAVPPTQGSSIARDDGRGFEIREVRKSADGQVNIFVREVNSP